MLFGQSENRLVQDCVLPEDLADRIAGLVGRATAVAFELDRLEQSGIKILSSWDLSCRGGSAGARESASSIAFAIPLGPIRRC